MKKHSPWWWIAQTAWWSWIVLGTILIKSCENRDYRIHPVTDDEIEYQEAIHNRGG